MRQNRNAVFIKEFFQIIVRIWIPASTTAISDGHYRNDASQEYTDESDKIQAGDVSAVDSITEVSAGSYFTGPGVPATNMASTSLSMERGNSQFDSKSSWSSSMYRDQSSVPSMSSGGQNLNRIYIFISIKEIS